MVKLRLVAVIGRDCDCGLCVQRWCSSGSAVGVACLPAGDRANGLSFLVLGDFVRRLGARQFFLEHLAR